MAVRDPVSLVVPLVGRLEETGRASEPYQLINPAGAVEEPVALYFAEMQAAQRPAKTIRSYGMDLLRWYRFLWAVGVEWDRAERADARDFARWLRLVDKPVRVHWRHVGDASRAAGVVPVIPGAVRAGAGEVNPVTGKPSPGRKFAASTRAHNETVVRTFYDFHLEAGNGPIINPFPLHRSRASGRAHAHHNPMEEFRKERVGRYRPTVPKRIPRRIPDEKFNELFAGLRSHRDRALLAFWVSSGVRSEELLTCREYDPIPGDQVISVIRKAPGISSWCPPRRMPSCGCGSTRRKPGQRVSRVVGAFRCGGRCVDHGDPWATPQPGPCSTVRMSCSEPTGRCTTFGIRPRTGWRKTRSWLSPMCSGSSLMPGSAPLRCT